LRRIAAVVVLLILIASAAYLLQNFFIMLPEPGAPPSEVVKNFAIQNKAGNFQACYYLMSSDYKSSVGYREFEQQLIYCTPPWPYFKLIEIGDEKITGNYASVEITYVEMREGIYEPHEPEKKKKIVELVKEDEGWKLRNLYCELRS
jgi:hypothetical protein